MLTHPPGLPPSSPAAKKGIARTFVTVYTDREILLEQRVQQLEAQVDELQYVKNKADRKQDLLRRCNVTATTSVTAYAQGHDVMYIKESAELQVLHHSPAHTQTPVPQQCYACTWRCLVHAAEKQVYWTALLTALPALASKCKHSFQAFHAVNRLGATVMNLLHVSQNYARSAGAPAVTAPILQKCTREYIYQVFAVEHAQAVDKPVLAALIVFAESLPLQPVAVGEEAEDAQVS
jgi:hypothetical protein